MVRCGSVGSRSACCKASPNSILGSAPQRCFSHWTYKRWGNGEKPRRMAKDKCIVWMWLNECMCVIKNMKNKQKEWHAAMHQTLKKCFEKGFFYFSQLGYYILKNHHSKQGKDYMISKGMSQTWIPNSKYIQYFTKGKIRGTIFAVLIWKIKSPP